jgi:hypothetical protein
VTVALRGRAARQLRRLARRLDPPPAAPPPADARKHRDARRFRDGYASGVVAAAQALALDLALLDQLPIIRHVPGAACAVCAFDELGFSHFAARASIARDHVASQKHGVGGCLAAQPPASDREP